MNRLFDKLALLLICLIGFCMEDRFVVPVIALLLSVSASAAVTLLSGKRIAAGLLLLCAALCGVMPVFVCALPLLLYDALWERKWWLVLPAVTVLGQLPELSQMQAVVVAAGTVNAVILYRRVSRMEETVSTLTVLRDEIAEQNLRLAGQNRQLARVQDSELHLAALRERNRIAREIHDNVGHMLTRSLLQSGALIVMNQDERLREPLNSLKDTLDSAMTGIRESVHNLHDDSIDLEKVIRESMGTVDSRFRVTLDYDAGRHVPGKVKLCVAGIVKEGLSNAVRHSAGNRIAVVFREHPGFYQLMIRDNGSCDGISESGIGLKSMEERADSIGGRIRFTPSKEGFCIFLSVPKQG